MTQSMFYEDKRKEELFGEWLDVHFYARLKEKYKRIERINDANLQKRGVDVVVETYLGKVIYVDEKASLQYINKRIPTFAFEICNTTSGARGWLYNPDYLTDYYLLAWPNAEDESIPASDAYTATELMIIKRDKVLQLLTDNGLSEPRILQLVKECLRRSDEGNRFEIAPGISLNFNLTLAERPINVVIRKELLAQYATYSATVG